MQDERRVGIVGDDAQLIQTLSIPVEEGFLAMETHSSTYLPGKYLGSISLWCLVKASNAFRTVPRSCPAPTRALNLG